MRLNVRNTFACSPERFWEMYWSDSFDAMLSEGSDVERELLEERDEGGVNIRRVRFTPAKELPTAAASVLGAKKLVYEQEMRYHADKGVMEWRVVPTILPGKLDASGQFRVVPAGDGCEQIVEGDISVNVRFVGGTIEKAVVAEVEKSYEKTAAVCREWLRIHGA